MVKVSKGAVMVACHGLVLAAAALALWAGGAVGASVRYDTATPYTPPYTRHKFIPLHPARYDPDSSFDSFDQPAEDSSSAGWSSGMPPSELILTSLRTILDVVRNINKNRAQQKALPVVNNNRTAIAVRRDRPRNATAGSGRGFEDYYDEHHDHDHHETTTTAKPVKQGRYTDPWAGYYDWIINEGSFKFWSVFQLFTAALLLYACLSAIYYAKFNPILPDYSTEYDDYFLQRTVGRNARSVDASELLSGLSWMSPQTFQFILDAIAKHYVEK